MKCQTVFVLASIRLSFPCLTPNDSIMITVPLAFSTFSSLLLSLTFFGPSKHAAPAPRLFCSVNTFQWSWLSQYKWCSPASWSAQWHSTPVCVCVCVFILCSFLCTPVYSKVFQPFYCSDAGARSWCVFVAALCVFLDAALCSVSTQTLGDGGDKHFVLRPPDWGCVLERIHLDESLCRESQHLCYLPASACLTLSPFKPANLYS